MPTENPSPRPLPRTLRRLIWLGLGVFALVCVLLVTWRTVVWRSHRRVTEIRERLTARAAAHRGATTPKSGASAERAATLPPPGAPEPLKAVRVDDLPVIGLFFTDPQGAKATFDELKRYQDALTGNPNSKIDFREVLKKLGLPVPEGMTQAEAAAAFLEAAQGVRATLQALAGAASQGPWDWGALKGNSPEAQERFKIGMIARNAMLSAARIAAGVIEAQLLTGDTSLLMERATLLEDLANRVTDRHNLIGSMTAYAIRSTASRTLSSDRFLQVLSDANLSQLAGSFARTNIAAETVQGLVGERDALAAWSVQDIRRVYDAPVVSSDETPGFSWKSALNSLPRALWTDALIEDNKAIILGDLDEKIARFDPDGRRYFPPAADAVSGAQTLYNEGGFLSQWYFQIAVDTSHGDWFGNGARLSAGQAGTDFAQLSAALELQRRATGQYPETLDALAPQLPNGLPHELITGAPYVYQRTPEGGYRLTAPDFPGKETLENPLTLVRPPPTARQRGGFQSGSEKAKGP